MKPLNPFLLTGVLLVAAVLSVIGASVFNQPALRHDFKAAAIRVEDDGWSEYNLRTEQANTRRLMTDLRREIRNLPVK